MTLMNANAYAHPSIMYAHWEGWDGTPVKEPPLFYTGLSEFAAEILSCASDELLNVSRIVSQKSGADTSQVKIQTVGNNVDRWWQKKLLKKYCSVSSQRMVTLRGLIHRLKG